MVMALGEMVSSTVIVAVSVSVLPLASTMVRTMVFVPISEQSKLESLKLKLTMLQLSVLA